MNEYMDEYVVMIMNMNMKKRQKTIATYETEGMVVIY